MTTESNNNAMQDEARPQELSGLEKARDAVSNAAANWVEVVRAGQETGVGNEDAAVGGFDAALAAFEKAVRWDESVRIAFDDDDDSGDGILVVDLGIGGPVQ